MSSEDKLSHCLATKMILNNNSEDGAECEEDRLVTVDISGKLLECDRRLLIQHSKYFEALFAFRQGTDRTLDRVRLRGIDHESASIILSAISGADVVVNGENAQSILEASTYLQCEVAERAAADYILSNLSFSNAFSAFILGLNCGSVYLAERAEEYIMRRLQTFQFRAESTVQVLSLNIEEVNRCLELIFDNDVAFGVICGWVLFNVEERRSHLASLLGSNVVAELVPSKAFDGASELEDEPAIQEALKECLAYELLPLRTRIRHWDAKTALPRRWPRIAVVCSTGNNCGLIAFRSPYDEARWLKLTTKPVKLKVKSSGSVVVACVNGQNQSLFFIGGVANVRMWSYNLKTASWKLLSAEQQERIRPLVCSWNSDIFVFGGYTDANNQVTYLDTACKFDTLIGRWTMLSPMECSRSGGQACAMDGNVYLFGGRCSRRRAIVSCEAYNVASDEFTQLTNLPIMIIDFGLVLVKSQSKVYIIGGMDPITFETKSSVLVFDLVAREWSFDFPSLNVARKSCGCYFDGVTMYVVAGSTAELDQLSSVERFNFLLNRWEVIECLPKGLAASTASVVVNLPVRLMENYRDFGQATMSS